ncbi:MAG: hypothetical protein GY821_17495 [Gammaproteobacteria bacterium]|nr:hypothetical protein [Gammaproteobacteria bacterium]
MDSRENLYEHEKWGRRVEGKLQKRTCFVLPGHIVNVIYDYAGKEKAIKNGDDNAGDNQANPQLQLSS